MTDGDALDKLDATILSRLDPATVQDRFAHYRAALAERDRRIAELEADAERYRAWRQAHAAGMRPFLPRKMPADLQTVWHHPFTYSPPDDEWMQSTPEHRCVMIDAALDDAIDAARKG